MDNHQRHISCIVPHLYLGTFHAATNKGILQQYNIKHILSVMRFQEANFNLYRLPDVQYHAFHKSDLPSEDLLTIFSQTFHLINSALTREENILIHCAMGISRSATIVVAYLMRARRWTVDQTIQQVKSARQNINPNFGFRYQLRLYWKMRYTLNVRLKEFRLYLLNVYAFKDYPDKFVQHLEEYFHLLGTLEQEIMIDNDGGVRGGGGGNSRNGRNSRGEGSGNSRNGQSRSIKSPSPSPLASSSTVPSSTQYCCVNCDKKLFNDLNLLSPPVLYDDNDDHDHNDVYEDGGNNGKVSTTSNKSNTAALDQNIVEPQQQPQQCGWFWWRFGSSGSGSGNGGGNRLKSSENSDKDNEDHIDDDHEDIDDANVNANNNKVVVGHQITSTQTPNTCCVYLIEPLPWMISYNNDKDSNSITKTKSASNSNNSNIVKSKSKSETNSTTATPTTKCMNLFAQFPHKTSGKIFCPNCPAIIGRYQFFSIQTNLCNCVEHVGILSCLLVSITREMVRKKLITKKKMKSSKKKPKQQQQKSSKKQSFFASFFCGSSG